MDTDAIDVYMKPIIPFLQKEGVTELTIAEPGSLWLLVNGDRNKYPVPELDLNHLQGFARLIANYSVQSVDEEEPLLSTMLPGGYRIQVALPPACPNDRILMSIRRQNIQDLSLSDYLKAGIIQSRQDYDLLCDAISNRKNILISGGTGSGKTTLLNACLKDISRFDVIATIEDSQELRPTQDLVLPFLFSRGDQSVANITPEQLLEACLRVNPDRIMMGELRGKEAYYFLRAVNTGHPGSITTLHADTPELAIDQLALMVLQQGLGLTRPEIKEYIRTVIDYVVQIRFVDKTQRRIELVAL